MRVLVGDRIVVESERASRSPRHGVIEEVLSVEPPRFAVRWGDGHASIFTPNAGVAQVEGRGRRRRGAAASGATSEGGTRMSQQTLPERRTSQEVEQERFDPFGEFEQVTERMQRLLDRTFGGAWGARPPLERGFAPIADIEEQDDAYVVQVELPGVKREDVTIELVGNELAISGEVKEEERKGIVRRRMRRYGRFDYRVSLPTSWTPTRSTRHWRTAS